MSYGQNMMKNFKWDPEDYKKHSKSQQKWAQELVEKLHLKGNETLLDIGCGDGKVTHEIAYYLSQGFVVGIDSSPDMIKLAKNKYSQDNIPNLQFMEMDARKLTFNNEFDIVFSNATLHWVKDHLKVLEGILRALKKNGRALLQMGGYGNAADIIQILKEMLKEPPWYHYFKNFQFPYGFYAPEEYEQWIKIVGFSKQRIELIPKDMVHQNQDGLEGWIRTTWLPYTEKIPEDKKPEFIHELASRYIKKFPPNDEGNIYIGMVRLEVDILKI
jgi:trans-aconitate 2-methyltransferase